MEVLTDTTWDVILSGTDLRNSLISLALSRSNKNILHIDRNKYYGDSDAAFSLDEADDWAKSNNDSKNGLYRNSSTWKATNPEDLAKLSLSRSYTLTLSPFIIYCNSKLLSKLVSSTAYHQLEFQAVGSWWIMDIIDGSFNLKKIPNGREDIFLDNTIDNRSKRNLMKLLKFLMDYENQSEVLKAFSNKSLDEFLSSQFELSIDLRKAILALSLTLYTPKKTLVSWAIPRLHRHLSSLGTLGPGFSAITSKWGCGAEISQVACRAGAVGGSLYILGTGIEKFQRLNEDPNALINVTLSNGCEVKTKHLIPASDEIHIESSEFVSRFVAITSISFDGLLKSNVEGAPPPAVCVVVFPPDCFEDESNSTHPYPIYIMVHSSETGECPDGQSILYATTMTTPGSKALLQSSIAKLFSCVNEDSGRLLFSLYYEFLSKDFCMKKDYQLHEQPIDLTFDDKIIDDVKAQWDTVTCKDINPGTFMEFEDRTGSGQDESLENDY